MFCRLWGAKKGISSCTIISGSFEKKVTYLCLSISSKENLPDNQNVVAILFYKLIPKKKKRKFEVTQEVFPAFKNQRVSVKEPRLLSNHDKIVVIWSLSTR